MLSHQKKKEKLSQSQTKNAEKKTETETDTSTRKPKTCKKNVVFVFFLYSKQIQLAKAGKTLGKHGKICAICKSHNKRKKKKRKEMCGVR